MKSWIQAIGIVFIMLLSVVIGVALMECCPLILVLIIIFVLIWWTHAVLISEELK